MALARLSKQKPVYDRGLKRKLRIGYSIIKLVIVLPKQSGTNGAKTKPYVKSNRSDSLIP